MEWIERLNSAVEYMEDHLLEKIDYEKVVSAVCNVSFLRGASRCAEPPAPASVARRAPSADCRRKALLLPCRHCMGTYSQAQSRRGRQLP